MTNQQIQSIYKNQMGYYLDLIVSLGLEKDLLDFGTIMRTCRFVLVFKNSAALDTFLLKVLVVANNNPKYLPVDHIIQHDTLCLTTTERNG